MASAEAIIHFELKYCERCGGLWLRRRDAAAVYCSSCARQMADIPRRRPQLPCPAPPTAVDACGLPRLALSGGCGA
jgi:hypothetical protein